MIKGQIAATWKMAYDGVCGGMERLNRGEGIHEAIIHTIKTVEDNPDYVSVGYGGLPNFDGVVELDAAYMDGDTLGMGGIISVQNLKNPIEVAYDLSRYKRNCLLSGDGALRYAQTHGFAFRNMLTERSRKRYLAEKRPDVDMELLEAYGGHDTVCVIGSQDGSMACGVSTSGLFLKMPGRVGDSPVVGSGFYSDSEAGSAAATGVGEDIMKGCLSFSIVERLRAGMEVQKACETALGDHIARLQKSGYQPGSMSVIAMDRENRIGAATNKKAFPFVVGGMDGSCVIYAALNQDGILSVIQPDEAWLGQYQGD